MSAPFYWPPRADEHRIAMAPGDVTTWLVPPGMEPVPVGVEHAGGLYQSYALPGVVRVIRVEPRTD